MPSLDARRHTIPDGADTPSLAGIFAPLLTVRDPGSWVAIPPARWRRA